MEKEKNRKLCHGCDECCRYINVEIDRPRSKSDFDQIDWFLLHKKVNAYIDWDNDWYLEFISPCEALDKKTKLCKIYNTRPQICREYSQVDCTRHNLEPAEKIYFKSPEDLKKYLSRKNKK